jgi:hypothetical protein
MMLSFQIGASLLAMSGAFKCGWTRSLYSSERAVDRQARARYITLTIEHCCAAWTYLSRDTDYRLNPCHVVLDQHAKSSMLMDMDKSLKIHSARYAKRISSMLLGTAE